MATEDHFSVVADAYRRSRPDYPAALFDCLDELQGPVAAPRRCWDVGCGSGQASVALAARGWQVIASDLAPAQLRQATTHAGVSYLAAQAEAAPLASGSMQRITVAQAAHWFDPPRFYAEARRVAAPGALLALWTYERPHLPTALDPIFLAFHQGTLGRDWPAERRLVNDGYRDLSFPFPRLATPTLRIERDWTLEQLLGYCASWSATGRHRARTGQDPLPELAAALRPVWPSDAKVPVFWPLHILAALL